jgi:hypothetical protein
MRTAPWRNGDPGSVMTFNYVTMHVAIHAPKGRVANIAMLDEIEQPMHIHRRFMAGCLLTS